ncbi:hypothetical protein DCCM_3343 [Desulfocucumis palustris]|uniref:Uncharacterized protein n=2 Tax=Desulfocucumis palustris TaxID=1898651 RepID=A0A2L2XJY7_9FIRM|nr:hypothetical protein DCCM_3343 [Desulfocucumis palustris]
MLEVAKNRLAQEQISEFLGKMQKLGFDPKEILRVIQNMVKEMKK